ncbi:MAG: NAD-dependent epimerase/dehydratase family protein [Nocardioides sp.]|uniref:NAD-dependent epimerase/dehydratase family protein n=1 Tax=Nocardioides sp. TaxID=35761 RepID=UPI0039E597A0
MVKSLVTGAAGFIASHLVESLLDAGEEVVAVDSLTDYYDVAQKRANLAGFGARRGVEVVTADVADPAVLDRVAQADVVYHLAGQPGVRLSWDRNFGAYVERNVDRTQQLLEAARSARVPRLVYASSSSVYGNQPSYPVDERALPAPFSPYGVTKLAAEHLCGLYAQNYGLGTVSLRFFTVYGPRQRPDMAFSRFIRSALAGRPLTITGDGTAIRDFTYVGDIVEALRAAGRADVAPGAVYNTCGTESIDVNGAIGLIAHHLGFTPAVERCGAVPGDVRRTGGSARLAEQDLGWTAEMTLAEGIGEQVAWERARSVG